jgi:hypothetical protein
MKIVVLLALLIGSMIPRNLVGSAGARSGAEHGLYFTPSGSIFVMAG